MAHAAQWYFTVWLAERLGVDWFGIVFSLPSHCIIYVFSWGCYSLACLQFARLILFASFLFSFLYFNGFIIIGLFLKKSTPPDGWDSGNSHGRGGQRPWKSRWEGVLNSKKTAAGVILSLIHI